MVPLPRAVAVVIRNHQVLVVHRVRDDLTYAVLPGGGIETGETPEVAVARELEEETGLSGLVGRVLWVRDDGGRQAIYFLIEHPRGTPLLGRPERGRSTPDNRYVLRWVGTDDLPEVDLRPQEIAPLVLDLLCSGRPGGLVATGAHPRSDRLAVPVEEGASCLGDLG